MVPNTERIVTSIANIRESLTVSASLVCPKSGIWLSVLGFCIKKKKKKKKGGGGGGVLVGTYFDACDCTRRHNGARRLTGLRDGSQGCINAEIRFTGL